MSMTKLAAASFSFTPENLARAKKIISFYPIGRQASAVLPLLDMAQRQNGNWLPQTALDYVAAMLDMPAIRIYEVASFYSMFNLQPVGENLVQVCTTTPCWLRGSDAITNICQKKLNIRMNETTADGKFTLREVECMGACVNAPMVQINDDYYEDLTPELMDKLLNTLQAGERPEVGSQIGRRGSVAQNGPTSLLNKVKANA